MRYDRSLVLSHFRVNGCFINSLDKEQKGEIIATIGMLHCSALIIWCVGDVTRVSDEMVSGSLIPHTANNL